MKASEAVKVHNLLHSGGGVHKDTKRKDFRSITHGGLLFVTQNLRKQSPNTTWVNEDPLNRKMTWVFLKGRYVGQIKEYRDSGDKVVEVHRLVRPKRVRTFRTPIASRDSTP